ncbi:MAG: hypothetical protein M1818_000868 [Claussenomyces sp. TS43310]|nr:MAG: hypothetical protein M1818_000868 [Claussenomyces sp. TS43310]
MHSPRQTPRKEHSDKYRVDEGGDSEETEYFTVKGKHYPFRRIARGLDRSTEISPSSRPFSAGLFQRSPTIGARDLRPAESASLWSQKRTSDNDRRLTKSDQPSHPFNDSICAGSTDPPRSAKEGHEWVWFPAGYWAERPAVEMISSAHAEKTQHEWERPVLTKRSISALSHANSGSGSHVLSEKCNPRPSSAHGSSYASDSEKSNDSSSIASRNSRLGRGFQYMSPTYPHFISPTGQPEGLYCKTKRGIKTGLIGRRKEPLQQLALESEDDIISYTGKILEGTSAYLQIEQITDLDDNASLFPENRWSRRPPGVAPWHRKNSHDTLWSVGSSIRNLLRGKTPPSSPYPEVDDDDSIIDQGQFKDPSQSLNSLSMELRRINTPPISEVLLNGQMRGFFFDLKPPSEESPHLEAFSEVLEKNSYPSGEHVATPATNKMQQQRYWWDADLTEIERNDLSPTAHTILSPDEFVLEVPEHLPTSPLCPSNHKHVSGGTGVCVYHGRNKSLRSELGKYKKAFNTP